MSPSESAIVTGSENKLAVYATDTWQVTPKFKLLYDGRLEYYRMSADQISMPCYNGFYIGGVNADGVTIQPAKVTKNKLNYAATTSVRSRWSSPHL